jgi:anti-anti-sigma factor
LSPASPLPRLQCSPVAGFMYPTLQMEAANGSHPDQRVVRLVGRLSIETVPEFLKVVRAETATVLILDFSRLDYLDSAGVGALIQMHVSGERNRRPVAFAAASQRVMAVLDVTRVHKILRLFPAVTAAEEALASPAH